jgi:glycosyltransferase involved in cell wall biosynthesis
MKEKIVISAINLTENEGGALAVLKECLAYMSEHLANKYDIIALVNNKSLFDYGNIAYYEFPASKKSWVIRLYYEYFYFLKFSEKLRPYVWFSLHDITPNVRAPIRAVYCHNPSPFYKLSFSEAVLDPKFMLFNLFYNRLYGINLKKNTHVIVQQGWVREKFKKSFGINNIIVAHPSIHSPIETSHIPLAGTDKKTFFYPAFPRVFKNFNAICEASRILVKKGIEDFSLHLTINGTENSYSRSLMRKFGNLRQVKFIGRLSREEVEEYYRRIDCLIFPSKLETWGMPITEFKRYSKPIILSDLEYAHETLGSYDKAVFFDPNNPWQISEIMECLIKDTLVFTPVTAQRTSEPLAQDWNQLFGMLLR